MKPEPTRAKGTITTPPLRGTIIMADLKRCSLVGEDRPGAALFQMSMARLTKQSADDHRLRSPADADQALRASIALRARQGKHRVEDFVAMTYRAIGWQAKGPEKVMSFMERNAAQ